MAVRIYRTGDFGTELEEAGGVVRAARPVFANGVPAGAPVAGDSGWAFDTSTTPATPYRYDFATAGWLAFGVPISNASTTVSGIAEEATGAEIQAQTAVGATGARLFVNPETLPQIAVQTAAVDGAADSLLMFDDSTNETRRILFDDVVPLASVTVAGVVEEATTTEIMNGQGTGTFGTGARIFMSPANFHAVALNAGLVGTDQIFMRDVGTGQLNRTTVGDILGIVDANNGLTRTADNFGLGGTLINNTTVTTGAFDFTMAGDGTVIHRNNTGAGNSQVRVEDTQVQLFSGTGAQQSAVRVERGGDLFLQSSTGSLFIQDTALAAKNLPTASQTATILGYETDGAVSDLELGTNLQIDAAGALQVVGLGSAFNHDIDLNNATNILTLTRPDGSTDTADLSMYVDDTNLARIVNGVMNVTTGIVTFTRDDTTTFTLDLSGLLTTDVTAATLTRNGANIRVSVTEGGTTVTGDLPLADLVSPTAGNAIAINADRLFVPTPAATADASQTVSGVTELATNAEIRDLTVTGGTGAQLVLTASRMATVATSNAVDTAADFLWLHDVSAGQIRRVLVDDVLPAGVANATTTVAGTMELATAAEVQAGTAAGTVGPLAITPATLPNADATNRGVVEMASVAEVQTQTPLGGTGANLFIRPDRLFGVAVTPAVDTAADFLLIDDVSLGQTRRVLIDDILPAGGTTTPAATTTVTGTVEIATQAEVRDATATGTTGSSLVLTPATLRGLPTHDIAAQPLVAANDQLLMWDQSLNRHEWLNIEDLPAAGGATDPLPTVANAASWTWNVTIAQAGTVVAPAGPTTNGYWEGTVFTDTNDFVGAAASNTGFVSETNPGATTGGAGDGEAIICSAGAALTKNNLFGGDPGPARVAMHWSSRA